MYYLDTFYYIIIIKRQLKDELIVLFRVFFFGQSIFTLFCHCSKKNKRLNFDIIILSNGVFIVLKLRKH